MVCARSCLLLGVITAVTFLGQAANVQESECSDQHDEVGLMQVHLTAHKTTGEEIQLDENLLGVGRTQDKSMDLSEVGNKASKTSEVQIPDPFGLGETLNAVAEEVSDAGLNLGDIKAAAWDTVADTANCMGMRQSNWETERLLDMNMFDIKDCMSTAALLTDEKWELLMSASTSITYRQQLLETRLTGLFESMKKALSMVDARSRNATHLQETKLRLWGDDEDADTMVRTSKIFTEQTQKTLQCLQDCEDAILSFSTAAQQKALGQRKALEAAIDDTKNALEHFVVLNAEVKKNSSAAFEEKGHTAFAGCVDEAYDLSNKSHEKNFEVFYEMTNMSSVVSSTVQRGFNASGIFADSS